MILIDTDNDSFRRMCANVPCDYCPAFNNCNSINTAECFEMIVKAIGDVDAEPVRHGKWSDTHGMYREWNCTNCGASALYKECSYDQCPSDYCPNCGEKMDGNNGD